MGVAGTGKTTLAKALLNRICAVYLDNNFVADAFFPYTRSDVAYMQLRPKLYSALYRIAQENLQAGNTVLIDAPHVKEMQNPEWREWLTQFVSTSRATLRIIRCFSGEDILRTRLQTRGEPRDLWKLNNWVDFVREQPLVADFPFEHLDLDTSTENIEQQAGRALDYLLNDWTGLMRNLG
jgi:predicted kinase